MSKLVGKGSTELMRREFSCSVARELGGERCLVLLSSVVGWLSM